MSGHLLDSRLRLASAILALVSVGLLASLVPRTSFIAHAAGDVVDAVGPVWQDQSVEQVLGADLGVVSEVRVWAAAKFDRGEAPVVAALLQGTDRELVRQFNVTIHASKTLQPYVLRFAPYQPPPGEDLILQFWVSPERSNYVIFGTTAPRPDRTGPTLNLNPTDQGPLAYEFVWRGDSWRAALEGSAREALRLAGGVAAAAMVVLLHPAVARRLGKSLGRARAAMLFANRPIATKLKLALRALTAETSLRRSASRRRAIYVFPWLIPAFAILHFLANNLILLRVYEAIVPTVAIMAGVTILFTALRLILKGSAPAAVFSGLLGILFFSYGHISIADSEHLDPRYVLGIGAPLAIWIGVLLRGRVDFSHRIGRALNFVSIVLVIIPLSQLGLVIFSNVTQHDQEIDILTHPIATDLQHATPTDGLPDIYYIILDGYPRSGSTQSFDNTAFIQELENRGFYVDPHARSNYRSTLLSLPSSLNMSYIKDPERSSAAPVERYKIYRAARNHILGTILRGLGYNYIHVSSGWGPTARNWNADRVVDFSPQGLVVSQEQDLAEQILGLPNRFVIEFARTTLLNAFWELSAFETEERHPYRGRDPNRALDWLDYMNDAGSLRSPKFVFAHLVKPHRPSYFDQYGNISSDGGWSDEHDPDVASAFQGQIKWLNGRMLGVIDSILAAHVKTPIIVISSDHGDRLGPGLPNTHDILAAYLLPDGGIDALYTGITSVNVFRAILDYYFELDLGLLDDEVF